MACTRCYTRMTYKTSRNNFNYCNRCLLLIAKELLEVKDQDRYSIIDNYIISCDTSWRENTTILLRNVLNELDGNKSGLTPLALNDAEHLGLI